MLFTLYRLLNCVLLHFLIRWVGSLAIFDINVGGHEEHHFLTPSGRNRVFLNPTTGLCVETFPFKSLEAVAFPL